MATRALIARQRNNKSVDVIYSHYDNYLEHNGVLLNDFYGTKSKVKALFKVNRDIRSLKRSLLETSFFNEGDCKSQTISIKSLDDHANDCSAEYIYLYTLNGKWLYKDLSTDGYSVFKDLKTDVDKILKEGRSYVYNEGTS